MKKHGLLLTVSCLTILLGLTVLASDRTGCYALVDKVVLEPSEKNPERIQIWGTFALPQPNDVNLYQPPQQGYLYFSLPRSVADLTRNEWSDLNRIAGKRQVPTRTTLRPESFRCVPIPITPRSSRCWNSRSGERAVP